jgi:anti-sigma factor RsiW
MTCKEALELVEPIAAADIVVDAEARAHFETCPRCAAALASARRIEMLLAQRPVMPAPARFTAIVMQRLRRERWRSEQHVDLLFNAAIAIGLLLIAGGVFALMNLSGLMAAAAGTWTALASLGQQFARTAGPTLNTYVAAVLLLLSALGMWWWAERNLSL